MKNIILSRYPIDYLFNPHILLSIIQYAKKQHIK